MTNQQAHDMILTWCRSEAAQVGGRRPVMRLHEAARGTACRVLDASRFDGQIMAAGADWIEVAGLLGVYGPQWQPAPVSKDAPRFTYPHRHYRRGRR